MNLDTEQQDRAAGVLLGQACGDALGVPYESGRAPLTGPAEMIGGGLGDYEPGEWSDDTQMAACIAIVARSGIDLSSPEGVDSVAREFLGWIAGKPGDVGIQTQIVLKLGKHANGAPAGARLMDAAQSFASSHERSAGNGALMRNGVVGLTRLSDREATATAAAAIAALTHFDDLAVQSCVLHAEAIRVAVTDGVLDLRAGLDLIDPDHVPQWESLIDDAENLDPATFVLNGFTVTALQAAWSAIVSTDTGEPGHLPRALQAAVAIGNDTDTVAAIAGAMLGARYGALSVPEDWMNLMHGWPGLSGIELSNMGIDVAMAGADR